MSILIDADTSFIVQGIRKMCALEGRNLPDATLLIVGATGDVGSGCARCLAPHVKRVLLNARNVERLAASLAKPHRVPARCAVLPPLRRSISRGQAGVPGQPRVLGRRDLLGHSVEER